MNPNPSLPKHEPAEAPIAAAPKKSPRTQPRPTDKASRAKWKHERALALGDKKPEPKQSQ